MPEISKTSELFVLSVPFLKKGTTIYKPKRVFINLKLARKEFRRKYKKFKLICTDGKEKSCIEWTITVENIKIGILTKINL